MSNQHRRDMERKKGKIVEKQEAFRKDHPQVANNSDISGRLKEMQPLKSGLTTNRNLDHSPMAKIDEIAMPTGRSKTSRISAARGGGDSRQPTGRSAKSNRQRPDHPTDRSQQSALGGGGGPFNMAEFKKRIRQELEQEFHQR